MVSSVGVVRVESSCDRWFQAAAYHGVFCGSVARVCQSPLTFDWLFLQSHDKGIDSGSYAEVRVPMTCFATAQPVCAVSIAAGAQQI